MSCARRVTDGWALLVCSESSGLRMSRGLRMGLPCPSLGLRMGFPCPSLGLRMGFPWLNRMDGAGRVSVSCTRRGGWWCCTIRPTTPRCHLRPFDWPTAPRCRRTQHKHVLAAASSLQQHESRPSAAHRCSKRSAPLQQAQRTVAASAAHRCSKRSAPLQQAQRTVAASAACYRADSSALPPNAAAHTPAARVACGVQERAEFGPRFGDCWHQ